MGGMGDIAPEENVGKKRCTISKLSDGAIMMEYEFGYQNYSIVMLRHRILSMNTNN